MAQEVIDVDPVAFTFDGVGKILNQNIMITIEGAPAPAAVFVQMTAAPAPPPETWGAYEKKGGKSNGVMALMDMLLKEMGDDLSEAKHDEETAQRDYEGLMSESQASREIGRAHV